MARLMESISVGVASPSRRRIRSRLEAINRGGKVLFPHTGLWLESLGYICVSARIEYVLYLK